MGIADNEIFPRMLGGRGPASRLSITQVSVAAGTPIEFAADIEYLGDFKISAKGIRSLERSRYREFSEARNMTAEAGQTALRSALHTIWETDDRLLRLPSRSLGLFSASAQAHMISDHVRSAEAILSTWALNLGFSGGAWRLPRLSGGAPWQPIVVPARGSPSGALLLRVPVDGAFEAADLLPEGWTWATILPDRVRTLEAWPLEPFDHTPLQEVTSGLRDWRFTLDRLAWNSSIEETALIRWTANRIAGMEIARRSTTGRELTLAYESASGSAARLLNCRQLRLDLHAHGFKRIVSPESKIPTPRRSRIEITRASVDHNIPVVHGMGVFGGRIILEWEGQRNVVIEGEDQIDFARLASLTDSLAQEVILTEGRACADKLLGLIERRTLARGSRGHGAALARAFAADGIALWRRLTPGGGFILGFERQRPDLFSLRASGRLRERQAADEIVRQARIATPAAEHPLGDEWCSTFANHPRLQDGYITLYPIESVEGLIGFVEILDDQPGRQEGWPLLLQPVFRVLETVLPHVGVLEHREIEMRRSIRHQIRPALNALEENTTAILDIASKSRRADATKRELNVHGGLNTQILKHLREFLEAITEKQGDLDSDRADPVIDFARLSARASETPAVDLLSQTRIAFEGNARLLASKNVEVRFLSSLANIRIRIPPENLQIMLTNIASNAAKYSTPESKIEVSADTSKAKSVTLQIANLGDRIDDQERNLAFERGFRAFAASQSDIQGEGLGLYHVREVAKLHGADVFYGVDRVAQRNLCRHVIRVVFPRKIVEIGTYRGDTTIYDKPAHP